MKNSSFKLFIVVLFSCIVAICGLVIVLPKIVLADYECVDGGPCLIPCYEVCNPQPGSPAVFRYSCEGTDWCDKGPYEGVGCLQNSYMIAYPSAHCQACDCNNIDHCCGNCPQESACGITPCEILTCQQQGIACGACDDGCGGTGIGVCPGQLLGESVCFNGGIPGGAPSGAYCCTYNTCTSLGITCGTIDKGCGSGQTITCGPACCVPESGQSCDGSDSDLCKEGTFSCDGTCSDNTGNSIETCNGVDDDCDGSIDEGNVCCVPETDAKFCERLGYVCGTSTGGTDNCGVSRSGVNCGPDSKSCYTGTVGTSGIGLCKSGTQTCHISYTYYGSCVGEVIPSAETCNSKDDDCNGQVDDGLGLATCGIGACYRTGSTCDSCTPGTPVLETCNNIDDDCDGSIDEGLDLGCGCGQPAAVCGVCGGNLNAFGCCGSEIKCNGVCQNPLVGSCSCICGGSAGTFNTCTNNCDGQSCNAVPANYGHPCNSAPNNCGTTVSGNIQCDGTCSGLKPADVLPNPNCANPATVNCNVDTKISGCAGSVCPSKGTKCVGNLVCDPVLGCITCGNNICDLGETRLTCPIDCKNDCTADSSGACGADENCVICPTDCGDCQYTWTGRLLNGSSAPPYTQISGNGWVFVNGVTYPAINGVISIPKPPGVAAGTWVVSAGATGFDMNTTSVTFTGSADKVFDILLPAPTCTSLCTLGGRCDYTCPGCSGVASDIQAACVGKSAGIVRSVDDTHDVTCCVGDAVLKSKNRAPFELASTYETIAKTERGASYGGLGYRIWVFVPE